MCGEFDCGMVWVAARYGDLEGFYCPLMIVSGDMPVTIGRELWGEPKKLGSSQFYRDGDDIYAYGERNGTRLAQIDATITDDLGPQEVQSYALEVNGYLGHDAALAADPFVAAFLNTRRFDSVREGTGELTLTGTEFDPVNEIPVLATGRTLHYTGESIYEEAARETLPDRETYLPYILGRSYDDLTRFRQPKRHRSGLATGAVQ
jgi:acetoacetate decarboxylase